MKNGRGRVHGESGCYTKLTRDVFLIALEMMRENSWTMLLAPLTLALPAATLLNYRDEQAFLRRWPEEVFGQAGGRDRVRWASVPKPAVEEWA